MASGRQHIAIGMAVEIATGIEILGEKIWGHDLKVLYINAEDSGARNKSTRFCVLPSTCTQTRGCNLDRLSVVGADDPRIKSLSFLRVN